MNRRQVVASLMTGRRSLVAAIAVTVLIAASVVWFAGEKSQEGSYPATWYLRTTLTSETTVLHLYITDGMSIRPMHIDPSRIEARVESRNNAVVVSVRLTNKGRPDVVGEMLTDDVWSNYDLVLTEPLGARAILDADRNYQPAIPCSGNRCQPNWLD